ncbi:hypothetical protein WMY93_004562 [Mugilogobius chulae]|uniref:Uncharacterized protein n=1 Tax=Mugilogobius chulae TaxID=88201 RepID=A0AAW0PYR5_9GOBI
MAFRDGGFDVPLAKCRKIVGHFKHSPANTSELKAQQVVHGLKEETLVQDVPTRWNSTLAMIKRILHNKEPLKATLSQQKHSLALLTPAEHDKMEKLETLLEPCRYITELLGGEKYVSCSIVLPALCHLQRTMEVSDVDPAYVVRFKAAFTKDLDKRKQNLNLAWLKVATALDPRFKDLKCLPRPERGEVWQTVSTMLREGTGAPEPEGCINETGQEPPPKKMSLLLMGSESESEDEGLATDNTLERVYQIVYCGLWNVGPLLFLEAENVPVLAWPAYSLDMSPIEHVWDVLDRRIRQRAPVPTNIQQLRTAIEEEWTNIPQATIDNLINSM